MIRILKTRPPFNVKVLLLFFPLLPVPKETLMPKAFLGSDTPQTYRLIIIFFVCLVVVFFSYAQKHGDEPDVQVVVTEQKA